MPRFSNEYKFDSAAFKEFRSGQLHMSQREMAQDLGCSCDTLRGWEQGRTKPCGQYVESLYQRCLHDGIRPPEFFHLIGPKTMI